MFTFNFTTTRTTEMGIVYINEHENAACIILHHTEGELRTFDTEERQVFSFQLVELEDEFDNFTVVCCYPKIATEYFHFNVANPEYDGIQRGHINHKTKTINVITWTEQKARWDAHKAR